MTMADEIADFKIKDICSICEWHVTNKKWLFMHLCEYPDIARHCFYRGSLLIHKAIENTCCFQLFLLYQNDVES